MIDSTGLCSPEKTMSSDEAGKEPMVTLVDKFLGIHFLEHANL